jgi:prophage regulatory protein
MLDWDDDVYCGHLETLVPFRVRRYGHDNPGADKHCQIARHDQPVVDAITDADGELGVTAGAGDDGGGDAAGDDGGEDADPDEGRRPKPSRPSPAPLPAYGRPELTAPARLERLPAVKGRCGLGRTTIYERIKAGTFPPPIRIGARAVAWLASDIDRWIAEQIKGACV